MIISFIRLTVPIYCNFFPEFDCLPKPWTHYEFLHEFFSAWIVTYHWISNRLRSWNAYQQFIDESAVKRIEDVIHWCFCFDENVTQGHGWKLNRTSYYQEGWLAAGNLKSVIGVTFTSTLSQRSASWASSPTVLPLPPRTNYNLRGHRAQVCDTSQFISISTMHFNLRCSPGFLSDSAMHKFS